MTWVSSEDIRIVREAMTGGYPLQLDAPALVALARLEARIAEVERERDDLATRLDTAERAAVKHMERAEAAERGHRDAVVERRKWQQECHAVERERDELDGRLSNAISALSDADGDRGRFIARAEKAERALAEMREKLEAVEAERDNLDDNLSRVQRHLQYAVRKQGEQ